MAFLVKALFRWTSAKKCWYQRFEQLTGNFFLDIEKFYQVLSTCQISDQLDNSDRNYRAESVPRPDVLENHHILKGFIMTAEYMVIRASDTPPPVANRVKKVPAVEGRICYVPCHTAD